MVRAERIFIGLTSGGVAFGAGDMLNPDLGVETFIAVGIFWLTVIVFVCATIINNTLKKKAADRLCPGLTVINGGKKSTIINGSHNALKPYSDASG